MPSVTLPPQESRVYLARKQSLADPSATAALFEMLIGKTVGKMQHALIIGYGASCGAYVACVCATVRLLIRTLHRVSTMLARPSQPSLAAAGVLCSLAPVIRPNALRIIFGLLLGVLAAFFIGALAPATPPLKAMAPSSAFALRFSPALPGWIIAR
jgi:hypothetical protein